MKKVQFCLCVTLLLSSPIFAQNFYMNLKLGYDLSLTSPKAQTEQHDISGEHPTYKNVKVPYNKGFKGIFDVGYMFNPYLGIEVGLGYGLGVKTSYTSYQINFLTDYSAFIGSVKQDETIYARYFSPSISMVITPGLTQWNPYLKLGIMSNIGSKTGESLVSSDMDADKSTQVWKYYGWFGIGFKSAIGVTYHLNTQFSLFAEVNYTAVSCGASSAEMIKYEDYNATTNTYENQLPSLAYNEKNIKYVKSVNSNVVQANNQPQLVKKQKDPFSSMGINVGVSLKLSSPK